MALSNAERETHFNMVGDDHTTWHIFTDDPYWMRRLEDVGATIIAMVGEGKEYTLPANQITVRKKRNLSDEQREGLALRLKEARSRNSL